MKAKEEEEYFSCKLDQEFTQFSRKLEGGFKKYKGKASFQTFSLWKG